MDLAYTSIPEIQRSNWIIKKASAMFRVALKSQYTLEENIDPSHAF